MIRCLLTGLCVLLVNELSAQTFQTGVDANYVLEMETRGMQWKLGNKTIDPYECLAKAGCNAARIRLWTRDDKSHGLKYATESARRAQAVGLQPYLVLFLSENWSDLIKQPVPEIWKGLDDDKKCEAIEAYCERVAQHFVDSGIYVDLFEIGNEIDFGLCGVFEEDAAHRQSIEWMRSNVWPSMAKMILAAQSGVRKIRPEAKFILHLARWNESEYCIEFWKFMLSQNVQVDYPGLSYFPTSAAKVEERSIDFFLQQVEKAGLALDRQLMICETGYPSAASFGGQFSDWNKAIPGYKLDEIGQRKWLSDFLRMTRASSYVMGVYYWSPEWCRPGMWEAFALFKQDGSVRPAIGAFSISENSTHDDTSKQFHVYFGNLHAHTAVSDGTGTPREAFAYARAIAKLDFMAITEHNHLIGGNKATKEERLALYGEGTEALIPIAEQYNEDDRFVAIAGQEFSSMSKGNHLNVFDARELIEIPNGDFAGFLKWHEEHLDSYGHPTVIQLNHPALGRPGKTINANEYGRDDFKNDSEWIAKMGHVSSLIELLNGEPDDPAIPRSPQIMDYHFRLYLQKGFRVAPTGNQDNHKVNWGTATTARTGVIAERLTRADVLEAMRARRVYATEDSNLRIVGRLAGRFLGGVITVSEFEPFGSLDLAIADDDESQGDYTVDLYSGVVGGQLAEPVQSLTVKHAGGSLELSIDRIALTQPGRYYFVQITQATDQGVDRAWTAPIWLEAASSARPLTESSNETSTLPTDASSTKASSTESTNGESTIDSTAPHSQATEPASETNTPAEPTSKPSSE